MRSFCRAGLLALAASFSIHLLPLIGPHALDLLGPHLIREVSSGRNTEPLWLLTDVGTALALQGVAFVLFYWFFRRPGWLPGVILLASGPALFTAAEVAYLVYIPSLFLIENDTALEVGEWPIECSAADSAIVSISTPQRRAKPLMTSVLVQNSRGEYSMMRIAGCETTSLLFCVLTRTFAVHLSFSTAGFRMCRGGTDHASASLHVALELCCACRSPFLRLRPSPGLRPPSPRGPGGEGPPPSAIAAERGYL